jgi:hypothetical protein
MGKLGIPVVAVNIAKKWLWKKEPVSFPTNFGRTTN